jgi:hypothetical protein
MNKFQIAINKAKEHFGEKDIVSRQEILAYEKQTGEQIPQKFWAMARTGRAIFSFNQALEAESNLVSTVVEKRSDVVSAIQHTNPVIESKFDYDGLIPLLKDTFVEWGEYKTVEKLIASNQFFTLYITGDSGSGKNEMVSHACAKLKRPMVRVQITRETKEEHLLGSKTLVDGSIRYEEGPVIWAAEHGALLILDELSAGCSNELLCLQNVLEGGEFFVKSANRLVKPVAGFCVIATDNTKGRGSDSGRFIGTNVLNDAFLERFEMTMEQGYPNEKTERKIIDKMMEKIGLDDSKFADRLLTWVHAIRKTYMEEGLEEHITTRRACHIIKNYKKLGDAEKAIRLGINRFDETTIMAMQSLWDKLAIQPLVPDAPVEGAI